MKLDPLDLINSAHLKGMNWFEGLRRIKIVIQWGVGGFAFLLALSDGSRAYGSFLGILFALFIAAVVFVGIHLVFKILVWIVRGFLEK